MAGTALARCGPPWPRAASVTSASSQGSWLCRAGTRRSAWEHVCAELSPRSSRSAPSVTWTPHLPPAYTQTPEQAVRSGTPAGAIPEITARVKWLRPHIVTGKLFSLHSLYMHIYVYMYACAYVHVCMHVCVCRCVYIYIYIYASIYIY